MIGKLTASEIEEALGHQVMGRIACHADGMTYIVPVSYAYDGACIYVHTREGMKVSMMRKNPSVCFETEVMENLANWKSVICWGTFEELTLPADRNHALRALSERILPMISSETMHLSATWPFQSGEPADSNGVIFRVRLMEKTGRFERNDKPTGEVF